MSTKRPGDSISRHHHITLATGGAQEDYDFHTRVLGLKSVKKTLLYDGKVPIYHFYYGNDMGQESTLLTAFPMRQTGRHARKGSGQISYVSLSTPVSALGYWKTRLRDHGIAVTEHENFGERRLAFQHPCGIDYAIVGVADDIREPRTTGPVPAEVALRGTHAIACSVTDLENTESFMAQGWGGRKVADDGAHTRFELGAGGTGTIVDFVLEPQRKPGSWALGEGFIHHMAFQVATHAQQMDIKLYLEGLGYTDCSDVKNRGYFDSIYVRTPGGPLFEVTVSHTPSFACDEPVDALGATIVISPQFEQQRAALLTQLEPLAY